MIFPWLRDRHRRQLLAQPFPETWLAALQANVLHYRSLTAGEQTKLRDDLRIIVAEKDWEGCAGLVMTDEIKVTIAAQACLLILCLEHDYYADVESILVYPAGYTAMTRTSRPGGVIDERPSPRLGEAWSQGPVVLSWADALAGGRRADDGRNVVLHEFAHKLDLKDGQVDGVPRLTDAAQYEQWAQVMSAEYQALVEQTRHGQATWLDAYGATDAGEFFAVATECFFERPQAMRQSHGRLYEVLRGYYRQDPAARLDASL